MFALLMTFAILSCLTGCDRPPEPQSAPSSGLRPGTRRIVAHSPALVEILFAIGAGDEVVGVSQYASSPPAARKLPKIGGLVVNLERVAELRPTLILSQGDDRNLRRYAKHRGIPLRPYAIESVAEVISATLSLGKLTDRSAPAKKEAERIRGAFDRARARVGPVRFSALLVIGRSPGTLTGCMTNTAGFLVECLEACGGKNAFADLTGHYPRLSLEAVLDRDPDLIVEVTGAAMSLADQRRLVADWDRLPKLKAVREKRIVVVSGGANLLPGPRVTETLRAFQRALKKR